MALDDFSSLEPPVWAHENALNPLHTLAFDQSGEADEGTLQRIASLVYAINQHLERAGTEQGKSTHGQLEQLHSKEKALAVRRTFELNLRKLLTRLGQSKEMVAAVLPLQGSMAFLEHTPPREDSAVHIEATRIESTQGTDTNAGNSHAQLSKKTREADIVVLVDEIGDRMKVVLQVLRERAADDEADKINEIDQMLTRISAWGFSPPAEDASLVEQTYRRIAELCQESHLVVAVLYSKNAAFFEVLRELAGNNNDAWSQATRATLPDQDRTFTPANWLTGGLGTLPQDAFPMLLLDTGISGASLAAALQSDDRFNRLPDPIMEGWSNDEFFDQLTKFALRTGTVEGLHAFNPTDPTDPDAYQKFLVDLVFDMLLQ